ncbi:MAG TPA: hypothetical protein ENN60_02835 [archaeon]|mgnify:CR=1 FL=1|nr:hypothetical protein [archaeon]
MERVMVVPLKKARRGSSRRFAPKALVYLRSFVGRHMKAGEAGGSVVIGHNLNQIIWERGITNPPRKVEVKAFKNPEGKVLVELASVKAEEWELFKNRGKPLKETKSGKADKDKKVEKTEKPVTEEKKESETKKKSARKSVAEKKAKSDKSAKKTTAKAKPAKKKE